MIKESYYRGFLNKCAEYDIDPYLVVKAADSNRDARIGGIIGGGVGTAAAIPVAASIDLDGIENARKTSDRLHTIISRLTQRSGNSALGGFSEKEIANMPQHAKTLESLTTSAERMSKLTRSLSKAAVKKWLIAAALPFAGTATGIGISKFNKQ